MIRYLVLIVLVYLCVPKGTAALECYSCHNVRDVRQCNSSKPCSHGQACFHNQTITYNVETSSMGCADFKQCGVHVDVQNTLVGRDVSVRQAGNCFECCSSDLCSRSLCEHLTPSSCTDDKSIDCARMNTLFGICADIDRAKNVCPNFCGLCSVVDGKWSTWSDWSLCDVTCGSGSQLRIRYCNNPAPKYGGQYCFGNNTESKVCHKEICPVNGGWNEWTTWDKCSVSCGMGIQRQVRMCSNPAPSHSGKYCSGDNVNSRLCMSGACANGGWTNWGSWATCTVTCGIGLSFRYRSCTNPSPSPSGQYCKGSPNEVKICSNSDCDKAFCESNPCLQGTCVPEQSGYTCHCNKGYVGRNCDVNHASCESKPCLQGTCVPEQSGYTCQCNQGYVGRNCDVTNAIDCVDILRKQISNKSGVYKITLWKSKLVKEVYCDMDTDQGGWTVFQNRFDGSVDFDRNFTEYENGFGSLLGEFWLGLKTVQEIVERQKTELRLDLTSSGGQHAYEVFDRFQLGNAPDYTLYINYGIGTAGDGVTGFSYHNGKRFYTYDHDNKDSCAHNHGGGFWFGGCAYVNLNGQFAQGQQKGVVYYDFDRYTALMSTKMMIRRS